MPEFDPADYSVHGLLRCYGEILDELIQRGVLRTYNSPVGDYAECLVAERLGLQLEVSSAAGYDAKGPNGERFQIKARWLTSAKSPRQLSTFRGLAEQHFDFLIAVLFNKDFSVAAAYRIPHNMVSRFARPASHVNGHNLHIQGDLLTAAGVDDITHLLESRSSLPTAHAISGGKSAVAISVAIQSPPAKAGTVTREGIHLRMVRSVGLDFYRTYIVDVRDAVKTNNIPVLIQRVRKERPDLDTVDYRINRMASAVRQGYDHNA